MKKVSVRTSDRTQLLDITSDVQQAVDESGVQNGMVTVFVPHTTAAVTINENADPSVKRDILYEINKIIPFDDHYHHLEGNAAAHIKSSLFGCSETILIENGHLQLGTWQDIYFCEFDGPRHRQLWLEIIGE